VARVHRQDQGWRVWPGLRPAKHLPARVLSGTDDQDQDVRVMLWSYAGQCDWWVSASSEGSLRAFAAGLLDLADLRRALWSNDGFSARLLHELRRAPR
jgi:hypothetical protein